MEVGLIFPPDQPPEALLEVARAAEDAGIPELWLWEDCFAESGIACAAAALAATDHLRVGIGLMPVPLRNVALTAMEVATLARMFPGRLLPGIGHGVLEWMGQAGVRADSPLTLLREYAVALRRLLDGEQVHRTGPVCPPGPGPVATSSAGRAAGAAVHGRCAAQDARVGRAVG